MQKTNTLKNCKPWFCKTSDTIAKDARVVQELRQKHSLEILLSIAQLPRASFYYHVGVPYQYDLTENCWSGHTESRGIVYDEYTDTCYAIRNNIGYASTALQSNFMTFDLNKARPSVYGEIGAVTVRKSPDAEEALPHRGFPCSI